MRALLVLIAFGCSQQREPPSGGSPVALEGGGRGKRSIDVTVDVATDPSGSGRPAVAIRGVEVVAGNRLGELEVSYRVTAASSARVPARITCRVGERNVVYPASAAGKVAGPRLSSVFRPDPFVEVPRACEIEFRFRTTEQDPIEQTIGRACWQPGEGDRRGETGSVRNGACDAALFPPPPLYADGSVVIERAALELRDKTAIVTGLYTVRERLAADRRFGSEIVCEDRQGTTSGEGDLAFVPLDTLAAHASIFGPLTMYLDRTPSNDARCVLRIVSRANNDAGHEQTHARYCINLRAVRAGACRDAAMLAPP